MKGRRVELVELLPWLMGALVVLLSVAAWVWFERNFERQLREVPTGWSPAAKRNPFLAAEHFLRRVGIEVESVPGRDLLRDLPPPGDLLVVNGLDALNAERRQRLRDWLERGGRLLVEAEPGTAAGYVENAARLGAKGAPNLGLVREFTRRQLLADTS